MLSPPPTATGDAGPWLKARHSVDLSTPPLLWARTWIRKTGSLGRSRQRELAVLLARGRDRWRACGRKRSCRRLSRHQNFHHGFFGGVLAGAFALPSSEGGITSDQSSSPRWTGARPGAQ